MNFFIYPSIHYKYTFRYNKVHCIFDFQEAVCHPLCNKIYMTHVYKDFPSDVFFPKFEHLYKEVK